MYAVSFYMKGKPKDSKSFGTLAEAQAFARALNLNADCEAFQIHFPR